jgi:excisionase family DNA binding protein
VEDRTIGRAFVAPDGKTWRPSMFLTLTMPSYGRVTSEGVPVDPARYDYRRAALDALHFPKLIDRFWQNLRRATGYRAQYFAAVEPQRRLAPHLHAAVRGAIPRDVIRQVVAATYHQVWWPPHHDPVYVDRLPEWDDRAGSYVDPDTRQPLPSWQEALDRLDADPLARPAHVMRFGAQIDMQGLIAGTPDTDRRIGYLCKYLTKSFAGTYDEVEHSSPARARHIDRLAEQVRWLPCSPECPNWLRQGIQPRGATAGMRPGYCGAKAHDREHLGLGSRRVLVSRLWTGKTLNRHRADRATVVRAALEEAGIEVDDLAELSAEATDDQGHARVPVDTSHLGRGRQRYLRARHGHRHHPAPAMAPAVRGCSGRTAPQEFGNWHNVGQGDDRMTTNERYLTVKQAAARLNTTERFPRRLIAERRIMFVRIGRHVRIPESALDDLLADGTVEPVVRRYIGGRKTA